MSLRGRELFIIYYQGIMYNKYLEYKQNQHKKRIQRPYPNATEFLNKYKPLSKYVEMVDLKTSKLMKMAQDANGFYYGEADAKGKNGIGVHFSHSGLVYQGNWLNGQKNGDGFEKGPNGWFYDGRFVEGRYQGKGTMQFISGDHFNGEWLKGEKNGTGIWKTIKGYSYIGEWKNNHMQGYGVIHEPNGDKYEGFIKKGKRNGKGNTKYKNGDVHKGFYSQNEMNGFGQIYYSNGNSFKGQFKNGKKEGPGTLKQNQSHKKQYQGYFKNDLKWGYGIQNWSTGGCYKGFYQRDHRHGFGQMFWPDGNIYRGWWKDGVQHGKGELFVQKQGLMKGIFNNNCLVLLTQKKHMTKRQYQNISSSQIKGSLPKGVKKQSKQKMKKNRLRVNKSQHRKVKSNNLDSIQFPLLFHNHSRLKVQRREQNNEQVGNSLRPVQVGMRRYKTMLADDNERQKNLHSVLSIHKNFKHSNKNSDSTRPSEIYQGKVYSKFWNQKTSISIKV